MTKYSFRHIAEIVNGKILQFNHDDHVEHLILDSRKIIFSKTSLFFALTGPSRDGHTYIADAYKKGVRNFVVSKKFSTTDFPEGNFIQVDDALSALQQLAAFHRKKFQIPVIGITGSNGKTIVKEWLNQLLEEDFNIVRSPKSYNSQIGVPLSVWQLNEHHQLAIFEAGISYPVKWKNLKRSFNRPSEFLQTLAKRIVKDLRIMMKSLQEKLKLFKSVEVLVCQEPFVISAVKLRSVEFNRARKKRRVNRGSCNNCR